MFVRYVYMLVLALSALLGSTAASAWTVNANFEGGTPGQLALGKNAYTATAIESCRYSAEHVHGGSLAAGCTAQAGKYAWGGRINFPQSVGEGEELWYRTYVYFPGTFDYSAGGVGLKFMRIHFTTNNYLDVLIDNKALGKLTVINELLSGAGSGRYTPGLGQVVPKGRWHAVEMYARFSATNGIFRVWQEGKLIYEKTGVKTLPSGSKADFVYLLTYWNDTAPKTQTAFVDDVIITTSRPANKDSAGNSYIGLAGQVADSAPLPQPLPPRDLIVN